MIKTILIAVFSFCCFSCASSDSFYRPDQIGTNHSEFIRWSNSSPF